MFRKHLAFSLCCLIAFSLAVLAQPKDPDDRPEDRAAILAHIESICQAFIDGDIQKIHATHTADWRGFLENSRVPIRGIDEYMRANGIQWPQPANATKPQPNPTAATRGFKVFDFDVHFYGPDLAVANFLVDFGTKKGSELETNARYRIMDIYAKRNGQWNQAASHTVVDPAWRNAQMTQPIKLPPQAEKQLLDAREAVWRSYFTGDVEALGKLIPEETIAMNAGPGEWGTRAKILEGSKRFAESGGKFIRVEFPKTEIQVYGFTAIIYTTYLYELEFNGQRNVSQGRATEIFVLRNNRWVNSGWHMDTVK
jgi:hypothetical protein